MLEASLQSNSVILLQCIHDFNTHLAKWSFLHDF